MSRIGWKAREEAIGIQPIARILLSVDATEAAITAARYAISLAKAYGAQIHAVFVVDERTLQQLLKAKVLIDEEEASLERDLEEDGRRYLRAVEKLAAEKDVKITTEVLRGIVHRMVIDKATEIGASLIIIGELGQVLSRKNGFYQEGEMIIRMARCPVLTVRGEDLVREIYENV